MRKLIAYFLSFLTIICCFTIFCIFLTEKTDLLGLKNYRITASFAQVDGNTVMSWQRYPYPCLYQVETYYKTTGLVEGEPEFIKVSSEFTVQDSYVVPPTAIPAYYKITAYGIFGRVSGQESLIPNANYQEPIRPVPIFRYTSGNPASLKPYLVWHSIPDGVLYELELLSGPPDEENTTQLSTVNHLYATRQVFTNGLQIDLTPYQELPRLYWRVRAMNLRKEPIGVFSTAEPIYIDAAAPVPDKPLLNSFDRMPNFTQPVYPVFTWIPMLDADRYEVELLSAPPAVENNTAPADRRIWSKVVDSSFSCYDENPRCYARKYYWRVRAVDASGNTIGRYSDTDSFVVEPHITRPVLAALGDSITHGGGAVSFSPANLEYSYTTYIDLPCINLGRSGDTSSTTLARFDSDVLPIMPRNLLIMTGSNSLRSSGISADVVIADLARIAEKCRRNDIRPIFLTLPPINPDNIMLAFQTPTDVNWLSKMKAINAFIRKQPYYIDLEPYFYDTSKTILAPEWANDGLHTDIRGKMLIGEIINMHKDLFVH
ncbi:GDSL-type esterase/lipase family protein [Anaerovibrio sp.]|uniref:GDSL-type esterase/lipase family protein n=1 Tax=Anaerovibrio sp. TaxID=1872532 RepID=UPI003F14D1EB